MKMKKISVLLVVFLLLLSAIAIAYVGNQPEKVRVFLEFNGQSDVNTVHLAGGKVLYRYELLSNTLAIEVPFNSLPVLLMNPNVVGYEFDAEAHIMGQLGRCSPWPSCKNSGADSVPQPPQVVPWGVSRIGANVTNHTGKGVVVCVVDTGIDKDHPDLVTNLIGGKNFVGKGLKVDANKWDDDNGHGTHVAGTIAATDNSVGVVGVAKEASLLGVKVLDRSGSGYFSDIIAGIDYCVSQGADVISMSLGSSSDVQTMHDAVDAADAAGVLVVAAAGNSGDGNGATNEIGYPAKYSSVLAVGATASDDSSPSWSSEGVEVELSAPGVNVLSTWNDGGLNIISGTSMATPHVSGVAALAMQANPLLTNVEIRALLVSTADDLGALGHDNFFGYGLVDAELN